MFRILTLSVMLFCSNVYALDDALPSDEDPKYLESFKGQTWTISGGVINSTITFGNDIKETKNEFISSSSLYLSGEEDTTGNEWKLRYKDDGYHIESEVFSTGELKSKSDIFRLNFDSISGTSLSGVHYIFYKDLSGNSDKIFWYGSESPVKATLDGSDTGEKDCSATYDVVSKQLHIPCVSLTGDDSVSYDIKMEMTSSSPMEFKVLELN